MEQERSHSPRKETSPQVSSAEAETDAAVGFVLANRQTFDISEAVQKLGVCRRVLRDAISDSRPAITLIDHPERFRITLTAVIPPGTGLDAVDYFHLKVYLGKNPVGESYFDLIDNRQVNPNWCGSGDPRAQHLIEGSHLKMVRDLLGLVHRTVFSVQSHAE